MANEKISGLSAAGALTGAELIEAVQGGVNVQTTTQAIANLAPSTSPFQGNWNASGNTLPTTNLVSGNEWYVPIGQGGTLLDPGDGTGPAPLVGGSVIKYISTGLWKFYQ